MTINTRYLARILFALFTLFIVLALRAQDNGGRRDWSVKLQKDYSKSYPAGSETVSLTNSFGEMKIQTWDKNEVQVEAHISVSANNSEYADNIIKQINIKDEKKSDRIEFATKIDIWNENSSGGYELRIDYTVHVPATARLYAENRYGPLTIGDYRASSEFVSRYGTFTAGKISNSAITVDYGKAKIENINDCKITARYSRLDIEKLSGKITGEFNYCSSIDMPIDNALTQLELKNNYTNLYLVAPKDLSADYDITTLNARLTAKNAFVFKEEVVASNKNPYAYPSNHKYAGTLGKSGAMSINIRSNYGNIRVL